MMMMMRYKPKSYIKRTYSFFLDLNRWSPNARDTAISPQILPFEIYEHQRMLLCETK